MEKEFETQILDIDVADIKKRLVNLGAREEPEVLERRWVFDMEKKGDECSRWIRLRQSGEKTTICLKDKTGSGVADTSELEVGVEDFEKTSKILEALPFFMEKYYQENYKQNFYLNNLEFSIKRWPMIPPALEIEGKSQEDVVKGLEMLDLSGKDVGHLGWKRIYKKYGIDLHELKILKFEE